MLNLSDSGLLVFFHIRSSFVYLGPARLASEVRRLAIKVE